MNVAASDHIDQKTKQLDWKSFAIGVLLHRNRGFGHKSLVSVLWKAGADGQLSGAATSTTEKWDANQKWEVLRTGFEKKTTREAGYEPFHTLGNNTLWRRRIK